MTFTTAEAERDHSVNFSVCKARLTSTIINITHDNSIIIIRTAKWNHIRPTSWKRLHVQHQSPTCHGAKITVAWHSGRTSVV